MDTKILKIGYAGSLGFFEPQQEKKSNFFKTWFWNYKNNNINYEARSAYYLFKAIQLLKETNYEKYQSIEVLFWGIINEKNKKQAIDFQISDCVKFSGYLSKDESLRMLNSCDILFLPHEVAISEQKSMFIPGKAFEYMKVKKPCLLLSDEESDLSLMMKNTGLAMVIHPFETAKIKDKLIYLIENKDDFPNLFQPQEKYIEEFDFKKITKKLSCVFDEVIK